MGIIAEKDNILCADYGYIVGENARLQEAMADQKRRIDILTDRLFAERRDMGEITLCTMNTVCSPLLQLVAQNGVQLPLEIAESTVVIMNMTEANLADRARWDAANLQPVWSAEQASGKHTPE